MKRTSTILAMLAALAGSAAASPYVLPSPQPGALTPYDWQPTYAIEGLYSIAENDMPDAFGVRGSFNIYSSDEGSTFSHQFSINIAPSWGSETYKLADGNKEDLDLFVLPVTAGYNIHLWLCDSVSLYAGAKAGYAWGHASLSGQGFSDSDNGGGFTFSVGGGLKIKCSDVVSVNIGYEFGRSYLGFDAYDDDSTMYDTHTIFVGLSAQF